MTDTQDRLEERLWSDLDAESRKPGPTMTITKAQYGALLALRQSQDIEAAARAYLRHRGLDTRQALERALAPKAEEAFRPDYDWTSTCPHEGDALCPDGDGGCRCECHAVAKAEEARHD